MINTETIFITKGCCWLCFDLMLIHSIFTAVSDFASSSLSGKFAESALFRFLVFSLSVLSQPPPLAPVPPVAPAPYPIVQHHTIWNGDNVLSASQREWAAEDAAQHALILAHWRIKLLRVRWMSYCLEVFDLIIIPCSA